MLTTEEHQFERLWSTTKMELGWEAVAPTTAIDETIDVPQTGKLRSGDWQAMNRNYKVDNANILNMQARYLLKNIQVHGQNPLQYPELRTEGCTMREMAASAKDTYYNY